MAEAWVSKSAPVEAQLTIAPLPWLSIWRSVYEDSTKTKSIQAAGHPIPTAAPKERLDG